MSRAAMTHLLIIRMSSQCQILLPTLIISTQNLQNFHIFKNFGKKFQNLEFFPKFSKTTKGPPLTSKGPPPPHLPITFFSQESPKLGLYNIKHNLARSCFQLWPSKSAPRVRKFREKTVLSCASSIFSRNFVTLVADFGP